MQFSELAQTASRQFTTKTRDDGGSFVVTRDDAPDWITDLVRHAHGGDLLPDDWRYAAIRSAVDWIADRDFDSADEARDDDHAFADGEVDHANRELTAWLASNGYRPGYCDEAREDGLVSEDDDLMTRIRVGQYRELTEVYGLVVDALAEQHESE
jgi:hypothetical protein